MARIDWSKANVVSPDPARTIDVGDYGVLSDREMALLKSNKAFIEKPSTPKKSGLEYHTAQEAKKVLLHAKNWTLAQRIRIVSSLGGPEMNLFIHQTAVAILSHVQRHGDATLALRLICAMPKSPRRQRLLNWFHKHSPVRVDLVACTAGVERAADGKVCVCDLAAAKRAPFYS